MTYPDRKWSIGNYDY